MDAMEINTDRYAVQALDSGAGLVSAS